jgi:hypothetical protein
MACTAPTGHGAERLADMGAEEPDVGSVDRAAERTVRRPNCRGEVDTRMG